MTTLVVVGPTDHLAKIAAHHGIRDPQRIWDDPDNAALRELRSNPSLLREGDEIAVPDRDPPSFEVPAGRRHGFRVPIATIELSCRLLDMFGEPLADTPVHAVVDDATHDLVTDGDGVLAVPIRASTERVRLELETRVIELEVGRLDPIDSPSGLRDRLSALGYLAGDLDGDDPEDIEFAISLLQHDNGLVVDGKLGDAVVATLEQTFGT